jgi:ribosomal-protein-alanine N-acetyltransferase
MLQVPEQLKTKRLLLRRMGPSDAPAVFEYASDPRFTKFLAWPTHQSITDAENFTRDVDARWNAGTEYCWALTLMGQDTALGSIACRIQGHMAEIGYGVASGLWGSGYATEAVSALLAWLKSIEAVHRVWATCDIENVGSVRVLEKAGMLNEGVLRNWSIRPNLPGEPIRDSFAYAWVRDAGSSGR